MNRWKHTSRSLLVMVAATFSVWVCSSMASVSQLDQATLIDTLAREGMGQLLSHLAQNDPGDDPVTTSLIRIGQLQVQSTDAKLPRQEQIAAYGQMLDAMRNLIETFPNHEQRPLWQTNLGSALLYEGLRRDHLYAGEFCEFGVPTVGQRMAFESMVTEAFEQLVEADIRFFHLQSELPRQSDHAAKRVETGLWDRMIKEYYKTKTPLLLAQAAYYTAMLDDDHPYYQDLKNPKIPRQKATVREERARLLDLCIDQLSGLVADGNDSFGVRRTAKCLTGRAMVRSKRYAEAIEVLDGVIGDGQQDLPQFLAKLAKADVIDQQGAADEVQQLLESLMDGPLVQSNLLIRLLVVDHQHLLKLSAAMTRPSAEERRTQIVEAYEVYERLLSNRTLGPDAIAALKSHIDARWESMVEPGSDLSNLPDMVLAAAGQRARLDGQEPVFQAEQLEAEGGSDERVAQLLAQAQPKLERAVLINTELLKRDALTPRVRAAAMFNKAWAHYLLAQGDPEKQIAAADLWTALAQQLPDQPISEKAITTAVAALHQLHALEPRPPGVAEAYERSVSILFEKFPALEVSDNERVYFAFYVLAPRGQHAEAVQLLGKMPRGHVLYFEAQRVMLANLKRVFDAASPGADKDAAGRNVSRNARRIIEEAQTVPADADPQQIKDARQAQGRSRLILADMAIARDQFDQVQAMLDGFAEAFRDEPDLVREAQAKGIVMMAQAGELGQLVKAAKAMMNLFPDDAAAVIDGVLSDITQRIDQLRIDAQRSKLERDKEQMLKQATSLAKAAQMLAELLLDWAVRQNMDQSDLVPYKLLLAKATRLAGRPEAAINILAPLLEQNSNDIDLIFHMAESLHAIDDEQSLLKAAEQYDRLIGGVSPPFPQIWWRAWLGRLQIMDKLNQSIADIPLRVRALELTDPNLGGEPYRSQFKRLQLKHTQ